MIWQLFLQLIFSRVFLNNFWCWFIKKAFIGAVVMEEHSMGQLKKHFSYIFSNSNTRSCFHSYAIDSYNQVAIVYNIRNVVTASNIKVFAAVPRPRSEKLNPGQIRLAPPLYKAIFFNEPNAGFANFS